MFLLCKGLPREICSVLVSERSEIIVLFALLGEAVRFGFFAGTASRNLLIPCLRERQTQVQDFRKAIDLKLNINLCFNSLCTLFPDACLYLAACTDTGTHHTCARHQTRLSIQVNVHAYPQTRCFCSGLPREVCYEPMSFCRSCTQRATTPESQTTGKLQQQPSSGI